MKKTRKKKGLKIFLMILTMLLIIALLIILVVQYDLARPLIRKFSRPDLYIIKDECSLIMNNLLHQIKNEDDCRIRCNNLCILEKKDIYSSTLATSTNSSCYRCDCNCR